jgi:hypothetical protein
MRPTPPNTALEPTTAPLLRSTVAGIREHAVRLHRPCRRLCLSLVVRPLVALTGPTHVTSHVLLFDPDGTLTDPKLGIVRCMRYALDRLARRCPSQDVLASRLASFRLAR